MPAKPQWLLRLPEILTELRGLDSPLLDRTTIEKVFQVRRRSALYLMSRLDAFQAGRTALVPREAAINMVEALLRGETFQHEKRQRTRLWENLDAVRGELAARHIPIPTRTTHRSSDSSLPPSVSLHPGLLTIAFDTTEDLLGSLFELSQTIARDFTSFQAHIETLRDKH